MGRQRKTFEIIENLIEEINKYDLERNQQQICQHNHSKIEIQKTSNVEMFFLFNFFLFE